MGGIGSSATSQGMPLRQKVFGGTFDFRREIIEGLHVGARWIYANVKTAVGADLTSLQPELQGKELDLTVIGYGAGRELGHARPAILTHQGHLR